MRQKSQYSAILVGSILRTQRHSRSVVYTDSLNVYDRDGRSSFRYFTDKKKKVRSLEVTQPGSVPGVSVSGARVFPLADIACLSHA